MRVNLEIGYLQHLQSPASPISSISNLLIDLLFSLSLSLCGCLLSPACGFCSFVPTNLSVVLPESSARKIRSPFSFNATLYSLLYTLYSLLYALVYLAVSKFPIRATVLSANIYIKYIYRCKRRCLGLEQTYCCVLVGVVKISTVIVGRIYGL